jgi:hypothetical protein
MTQTTRRPKYSMEEFAERGKLIYERDVLPSLSSGSTGQYVAIDIDSGAWEIDQTETGASTNLRNRYPESQTWVERVGFQSARRFGAAIGYSGQ